MKSQPSIYSTGTLRIGGLVTLLSLSLFALSCDSKPASPRAGASVLPVQKADSQTEAVRLARQHDLPALDSADRVLVETAVWAGSKKVSVTDRKVMSRLKSALVVSRTPPSGGDTWATLTWFRGEQVLREVWVFKYGEWGFERPSMSPTIGSSEGLPTIIKDIVDSAQEETDRFSRIPRAGPRIRALAFAPRVLWASIYEETGSVL